MQQATLEITLPTAPAQPVPQAKRIVTVLGSIADGSQDVAVSSTGPITIKAGVGARITVGVVEVLVNGRQSTPASITFTPADYVEAVAADPTGFTVKVIAIEEASDAEVLAATPADTMPAETHETASPVGRTPKNV